MEMTMPVDHGILRFTVNEHQSDTAVAVGFKDMIKDLTTRATGRVVVDLSAVNFVDSSSLGGVVGSIELGRGRRMDLVRLSPWIDKVFRMTRMGSVFRMRKRVLSRSLWRKR